METPNPGYYAILPAHIRYDERLKPMEKLYYAEVTALAQKDGYCYATNTYFAKLYGVHKNTVSTWASNLVKCGYFDVKLQYKPGTKQVVKRLITPINEIAYRYKQNHLHPINEIIDTPINEITEGNNTRVNNTSNNNKNNTKEVDYLKIEKELAEQYKNTPGEMLYPLNVDAYPDFLQHREDKKNKVTTRGAKSQIRLLCKYPAPLQDEMIQKSIRGGYLGLFELNSKGRRENDNAPKDTKSTIKKFFNQGGETNDDVIDAEVE